MPKAQPRVAYREKEEALRGKGYSPEQQRRSCPCPRAATPILLSTQGTEPPQRDRTKLKTNTNRVAKVDPATASTGAEGGRENSAGTAAQGSRTVCSVLDSREKVGARGPNQTKRLTGTINRARLETRTPYRRSRHFRRETVSSIARRASNRAHTLAPQKNSTQRKKERRKRF